MESTFWPVFAAVLGANLLTISFVWGLMRADRQPENPAWSHIAAYTVPLLACASALMISLDAVPDWLNAALQ